MTAGGQRRDDPDHGPDLDRDGVAGRGDQPVVEQPVGVVPQALAVQGSADAREMLEELQHQVLRLAAAGPAQGTGDGGHGQRVGAHPAGGVGLLQGVAGRQVGAVDRADVVQAEEAALEQVVALGVLPVHPPGEVDQELVEDPGQEVQVAAAVDGPHLQRRPGVDRRVDVAEVPLIGRQRPVGVLEPLPAHQDQLVLGERRVQVGQRHGVEGQVPGGEPGVLPLVRHGDDVEPVEVTPPGVPPALARLRRFRLGRVAVQPAGDVVVEQLLAPQHPGARLPQHQRLVRAGAGRGELGVELVRLGPPQGHHLSKPAPSASARSSP